MFEKKNGQWSTSSPFHAFRHELAHALQHRMQKNDDWYLKLAEIEKFKESVEKELTNLMSNNVRKI